VTSQNHGYGIDPKSLAKTGFGVWFSNADDNTVEGIEHKSKPIIAVQFHPEASPGPYDCMFVFDRFREIIANGVRDKAEPAAAAANVQYAKKTIKPLKKSVRKRKEGGGRKIAKK
jgi:carbamoyl-phosphate synthase small subunit